MSSMAPIPVDLMQSWLDVLAVWATVGAALVTAVTAVLIWLQILQTKRSVEATEQTLALAREEQEQNRELITNARKSRIDAELPKVLVWIKSQTHTVKELDARGANPVSTRQARELPAGKTWSLPDDGETELIISLSVAVSNDGPRRARMTIAGNGRSFVSGKERVISVGEETVIDVTRLHTVADWVAMASEASWAGKGALGKEVLTLTYVHQGTEGAIEKWVVRQSGSPLIPVSGMAGHWKLAPVGGRGPQVFLSAEVDMPRRVYYSSMSDQILLA